MPNRLLNRFFWLLLLSALVNANAYAELDDDDAYVELGAGISGIRVPHYAGSNEYRTLGVPFPYLVYETRKVSLNRDGLRRHLYYSDTWDIDLSFAARFPVGDENKARTAMPDLDWVGLGGPSINYKLINDEQERLTLMLPLHGAIVTDFRYLDSIGWEAAPGIKWESLWEANDVRWSVLASANSFYASREFNGYYYDVAAEYATPERPVYSSQAGHAGHQAMFGFTRREGKFWFGAFIRYRSVKNATFADSPLVTAQDNEYIGVAFAYILSREKLDRD
ncbi:MAG: MipA/OmpV family protein [Gammaproteobacteria bacterium]|nr:MipA/OmpV family protein [Gammaproteobacteria bacterium]